MKRRLYAPVVLCIGLLCAQIVATVHVYRSNLKLQQTTETVMRTGYLAVPNARVAARLDSLSTAMAGGLFFTLSIGAGLTLGTLIVAWLWDRVFRRELKATVFCLLIWVAGVVLVNTNGWNLAATTYLVVVPLMTAFAAIRLLPARTTLFSPRVILWPVAAAILLTLLWGLALDRHLFINIRDHLLLGNPIGRSITEAYYAYTLFPAEAFKSLKQKQIRTCVLNNTLDRVTQRRLEPLLRTHGYLPIAPGHPTDLTIGRAGDKTRFRLGSDQGTALIVDERELFGKPDEVLSAYSRSRDRNRIFRSVALAGLLIGFPLVLYTFIFCGLVIVPNLFVTVAVSDLITAILCVLVGTLLLIPVYRGYSASAAPTGINTTLAAPSVTTRIALLRQACQKRQDITMAAKQHGLEKSPHTAERYWLARSLACAEDPGAHAMLAVLADDPQPIVACQALWAMGARRNRTAIPIIIGRIKASPHWYIQMYGYRALRTLGWVQPRSRQLSY